MSKQVSHTHQLSVESRCAAVHPERRWLLRQRHFGDQCWLLVIQPGGDTMIVVRIMHVAALIGVVWLGQQVYSCLGLCLSWSLDAIGFPTGGIAMFVEMFGTIDLRCSALRCSTCLSIFGSHVQRLTCWEALFMRTSDKKMADVECVFGSFRLCPSMWETLFFLGGVWRGIWCGFPTGGKFAF